MLPTLKAARTYTKEESDRILASLRQTLESTASTLNTISETRSQIAKSMDATTQIESKWKEVQDKFQEVLDKAIGDFAQSVNKGRSYCGEEKTVHAIGEKMKSGGYKKIVVLTGAGISTSCGIPDFRSKGGVYTQIGKEFPSVSRPEDIFSLAFFKEDHRPFANRAELMNPFLQSQPKFTPSVTHSFLRLLETKNVLLRNYTQNIDSLERTAGVTSDRIVECHGSFSHAECVQCGTTFFDKKTGDFCDKCEKGEHKNSGTNKSRVKAAVVLFGENLRNKFLSSYKNDLDECDLCIVIGTSLRVPPVSTLPTLIRDGTPRILINNERVGCFELHQQKPGNNCIPIVEEEECEEGEEVNDFEEQEDVSRGNFVMLGSCDEQVIKLAKACGMYEELMVEHRAKIEEIEKGFVNMKSIQFETFNDYMKYNDGE